MIGDAVGGLLVIDAGDYRPHPLHGAGRTWSETNCYVDLWIELLHTLGFDPRPAAACALSADFEGDQWTFLKFAHEDLRALYGIEVAELNVWRPVVEHVVEQLGFGRLVTLEVDSWHLPDTAGLSYRLDHLKTTILAESIDDDGRRLGYFHNAGYFELGADDFDGVFAEGPLAPYVEIVKLDRLRPVNDEARPAVARGLVAEHLRRRAVGNPVSRFAKRLEADIPWLGRQDLDTFHRWAFGTCRQCGATAELAASLVDWLAAADRAGPEGSVASSPDEASSALAGAGERFRSLARGAKALEFGLARLARGRVVAVDGILAGMEHDWDVAMAILVDRYGVDRYGVDRFGLDRYGVDRYGLDR